MTRVSENSKSGIFNYNLAQAKEKLEGLQLKGSSLKRIARPSDDPAGSVSLMALRSHLTDNRQFVRNLNYAKSHLELTESAIRDLSNVIARAKEIAIAYSSDTLNKDVRGSAVEEVNQLFRQSVSIANRRMGHRYLFGGHVTHRGPFNEEGSYLGDEGRSFIEIRKDFFIPINLTGVEVFLGTQTKTFGDDPVAKREIASEAGKMKSSGEKKGVFGLLKALKSALQSGRSNNVQRLLDPLDQAFSWMVTLRTRVGAIHHSVVSAEVAIGDENVASMDRKSKIEDADVSDLFSELEKQNNILKATYQTGASSISKSLLDFVR